LKGDSGGPLYDAQGRVVGATSFGAAAGCEAGYPACFTAVPSYTAWINQNTRP
jgi:secreted trypsin-like serine protease